MSFRRIMQLPPSLSRQQQKLQEIQREREIQERRASTPTYQDMLLFAQLVCSSITFRHFKFSLVTHLNQDLRGFIYHQSRHFRGRF